MTANGEVGVSERREGSAISPPFGAGQDASQSRKRSESVSGKGRKGAPDRQTVRDPGLSAGLGGSGILDIWVAKFLVKESTAYGEADPSTREQVAYGS
jgi:hypothetical protein